MDGTHDISRVFRPPGTFNHKLNPVGVKVMRYDEGARYNPTDFEQYLIEVAPEEEHEVNFEEHIYHPLAVFDGQRGQLITPVFRAGNTHASHRTVTILRRIVTRLRRHGLP
jgi:hypothetical protein